MSGGLSPRPGAKPNFRYIDCARGYAVLMVITCHLTFQLPNLPYPIHRLTAMGWWGVELFFLASCVTLLMSWHHEAARNGAADPRAFFIRRFFRIAPAYYTAAAFYFFLLPPSSGFDARQLLAAMLFINAWHPVLTPTVLDGWNVVPGGWSISVEFCFYLIFPFFAAWTTSFARASGLALASIVIAVIANRAAYTVLSGTYDPIGLGNFLFFWPPNQFPIFALNQSSSSSSSTRVSCYPAVLSGVSSTSYQRQVMFRLRGESVFLISAFVQVIITLLLKPIIKLKVFLSSLYLTLTLVSHSYSCVSLLSCVSAQGDNLI